MQRAVTADQQHRGEKDLSGQAKHRRIERGFGGEPDIVVGEPVGMNREVFFASRPWRVKLWITRTLRTDSASAPVSRLLLSCSGTRVKRCRRGWKWRLLQSSSGPDASIITRKSSQIVIKHEATADRQLKKFLTR